jgi:CelD/BcsL family acetyltransferase involved in cellulose biosynthesis
MKNKTFRVTLETFDSLASYWLDPRCPLKWECLFVLPAWLKAWWSTFGNGLEPYLCGVKKEEELVGIAPLLVRGENARLMGDKEVCDYLDFVIAPGKAHGFFHALIKHLREQGINTLDLGPLRADSTVLTDLTGVAKGLGCKVSCKQEDVSLEMDLPASWDDFLRLLTGKERHEIRRKLRRLHEAADITYRIAEDIIEIRDGIDTFLTLFVSNRSDKAAFMNSQRVSFFRSLAESLAEVQILKLCFLELDGTPAAALMCFDYKSTIYLYNNGYDRRFRSLSVGLLSKVLSIKESIERGRKKYDLLKGDEAYKYRLGGKAIPLFRCEMQLG